MSKSSSNTGVIDKSDTREGLKQPPLYKVVFVNDDYTSMEFVVAVLIGEFRHPESVAQRIMMDVHQKGKGVAGVFTREIAETKAVKTMSLARKSDYPLEVTIEPE